MNNENEIWLPVSGFAGGFYDGLYEISNFGRFKMLSRWLNSKQGGRVTKEKIIHGYNSAGYRTVNLKKDRKSISKGVHILVATAFIPNPDGLPIINHKDANPSNNHVDNLEWTDYRGNALHAVKMGLLVPTKGSERSSAKLSELKVRAIRDLYETGNYSFYDLSIIFEVGKTSIQNVLQGRKWKHVS